MKRQVEENFDAGVAGQVADKWKSIGATLTEMAVDFQVIVNGSQGGWTGSAAEGARAALAKVGKFSDMTGDHFTATGTALHTQTTAAAEAKNRMPEPVEYDPKKMFTDALTSGSILQLAALPMAMPAQKAKSDGAKAEAVQVMQSRDDAMRSATSTMPAFAEMPAVTQDQGTATSSTHTSSVTTRTVDPSRVGPGGVPGTTATTGVGTTTGTTTTSWAPPPNVAPPTVPPNFGTPPPTQPPRTPLPGWLPPAFPPGGKQNVPPGKAVPPGRPLPPGARP
ncbi:PPE domain-containing protein, partial [Saccharothrix hoggarensis]